MKRLIIIVFSFFIGTQLLALSQHIPRTIVVLYNGKTYPSLQYTNSHQIAEMPLNQLGLKTIYYDIYKPLPNITNNKDIRGIFTWFEPGTVLSNPKKYINWLSKNIDAGKTLVIIGDPGFFSDEFGRSTPKYLVNAILNKIGLNYDGDWHQLTYNYKFINKDNGLLNYERKLAGITPDFYGIKVNNSKYKIHLSAVLPDRPSTRTDLITTGPKGSYIAEGFAIKISFGNTHDNRQWYINPFLFFQLAFHTNDLPKPDTTTLAGNRIFFSHIDGDGWNNRSLIDNKHKSVLSSEIIFKEIFLKYPDIPVAVGAIAADLNPEWVGGKESQKIAKKIFNLNNIELLTHTYSHPFEWAFFKNYTKLKETPFLKKYPFGNWLDKKNQNLINMLFDEPREDLDPYVEGSVDELDLDLHQHYDLPRAYANKPFDLKTEIEGSSKYIQSFAPKDKKVVAIGWSGNTSPFLDAIKMAYNKKLLNINGGDSRYDQEYPSVSWVSSIGRQVGPYWQIYAANSNENTYTHLWTKQFYGFQYLNQTIENTNSPIRLKPINLYYHMYSGERIASLNALKKNIAYIQKQNIIPIHTSEYIKIALGFYQTQIIQIAPYQWKIKNRGELQTIRFDHASFINVNFSKSIGVIGQNHLHGSLYVYLDKEIKQSIIQLSESKKLISPYLGKSAYLLKSNWQVWDIKRTQNKLEFLTQGWGKGEMTWILAKIKPNHIQIYINGKKYQLIKSSFNHEVKLNLPNNKNKSVHVILKFNPSV